MGVQPGAGDARLHPGVEIGRVDLEDRVHAPEIDRNPALECRDVALERRAGAEGDHRNPVPRRRADDLGHLLGGAGEGDRIRRMAGEIGHVLAVLLAYRGGGGDTLAKSGAKLRYRHVSIAPRFSNVVVPHRRWFRPRNF